MSEELVTIKVGIKTPATVIEARERAGAAQSFEEYLQAMIDQEIAWTKAGY